jgi:VanZ family protein
VPYFKSSFSKKQKINHFVRIALATSVWGITVEFLQKYFIPSRDFELLDWAADSVGALIALWLSFRILKYLEKKHMFEKKVEVQ